MARWEEPYTATCHLYTVDKDTWETENEIGKIRSFSITRSATEDVPLLESCSMQLDIAPKDDPVEGWYRMVAHISQGGRIERHPLMTFLRQDGERALSNTSSVVTCTGYSVLKPADLMRIDRGYYVPKGVRGPEFVRDLLREGGVVAPIHVKGSFDLTSYLVFDLDSTYIQAAWQVLDANSWVMFIDANGEITISEKPDDPVLVLDRANAKLVKTGGKKSVDNAEVCNRYFAIDGDAHAVAVNDLPESRMSVQNRGLYSDIIDSSPALVDGESLDRYAMRMLKENSIVTHKYQYERRYWPDILPFSIVRASLGSIGMIGDLRVLSQTITFQKGLKVSETAGYEEVTYDPWQIR